MKRLLVLLLTIAFFTTSALAEPWRVFDNADLFSDEEIQTIEQAISDFQRSTNVDFSVLTMDDYLGVNVSGDVAKLFFDSNNFGFGRYATGIVYFFHTHNDMLYANFGLNGEINIYMNDEKYDMAADACRQFVNDGNYCGAVLSLIESATEAVIEYKKDAE